MVFPILKYAKELENLPFKTQVSVTIEFTPPSLNLCGCAKMSEMTINHSFDVKLSDSKLFLLLYIGTCRNVCDGYAEFLTLLKEME